MLRARKTPIVLFSVSKNVPLVRFADEYIYVANTIEYLDCGGTVFSIGIRYVMDVLFSLVLAQDFQRIEKNYDQFEDYLGKMDAKDRLW